jgi:outer membrane protein TolC
MKRIFIIFCVSLNIVYGQTLDTLSLEKCHQLTRQNYPLLKEKGMSAEVSDLKIKNIEATWFPNLDLNGQATYQSDVVKLDINLPIPNVTFPVAKKDQYKVSLDVNQMVYDGGLVTAQKQLEKENLTAEVQSIEVKMYQLKDRINQIYFMILLFQEKEQLIKVLMDDLKSRLKTVESGVKNGALMQVNADILNAEIMKVEQQIIEIETGKQASIAILSDFIGTKLPAGCRLKSPSLELPKSDSIQRPELQLLEFQKNKLDALTKVYDAQRMPKVVAFGQFGYGRPGLNMLSDKFDTYYLIGAKASWNVWDWDKNKRQKQINLVQKNILSTEMETFNKNINISTIQELGNIRQMEEMIKKDKEIIELRSRISKTYSSQLENGVITSTEYVTEVNAETQAKLNLELHKIQLLKAKANYLTNLGK